MCFVCVCVVSVHTCPSALCEVSKSALNMHAHSLSITHAHTKTHTQNTHKPAGDTRLGSMETGTALARAAVAVVRSGAHLINMSFGEPAGVPEQVAPRSMALRHPGLHARMHT